MSLLLIVGFVQAKIGFFLQLGSIAGHLLGFFLSLLSTKFLLDFIEHRLTVMINPLLLSYLSYLALYIIFFIVVKYVGYSCSNMMKGTRLEIIDNVLGFMLGIFMCFTVLLVVITLLDKQTFFTQREWYTQSFVYNEVFQPAIDFFRVLSGKVPVSKVG